MLRKLLQKMGGLVGDRSAVDPSRFADPVANKTQWTPVRDGGASFCTRKLARVNPFRIEFRPSIGAMGFYAVFLVVGIVIIVGFSGSQLSKGTFSLTEAFLPFLVGVVFVVAGACMLYFGTAPIVFDKRTGYFWKGRTDPNNVVAKMSVESSARIEQIHSLQLISEYCHGNKNSYYSYELNLVLSNGTRVNVIDHGNLDKIRRDARALSVFLGRSVWDAI